MDFGLDTFFLGLFKEHWILIISLVIGGIVIKLFFEEILPSLIQDYKFKKGALWRSGQDLLHRLRGMHPDEFEEYVAALFRKLGYRAEVVGRAGNHGIDVEIEKNGVVSYIQCKKYAHTHKVGEPEVRNFLGSLDHKHAQAKGYFVTTGIFTLEAERFAEGKPIELVDGSALLKYIQLAERNTQGVSTVDAEICPRCGGLLVERDGKFGKFIGCSNFPKCQFTKDIGETPTP